MTTQNELSQDSGTLEHSRRMASQAMERAGDKVRDLGFGVKDLTNRSLHTVTDKAHAAQRQLGEYASATGRYVTEQPLKSALIAAAVGAVVAGLILALRRSRHDDL